MHTRLRRILAALGAVFVLGTVGYRLIEDADWWESFYMTAITLTTVGYREVFPLSHAGEAFTVVLLLVGLGVLLLAATEMARSTIEGEIRQAFGRFRRSRMIVAFSGHHIVCGWGRMGQAVVQELRNAKHQVVIIESSPEKVHALQDANLPVVAGDATDPATLEAAGVRRASGLVSCLDDDAHNVYAVLTARSLNPSLTIVARASGEGAEDRLHRAGADRVVNPYLLGGIRLAHLLEKPAVVDFLDFSRIGGSKAGLHLAELPLAAAPSLVGRALGAADLQGRWGMGVIALLRDTEFLPNPDPALVLRENDVLVVLGTREGLEAMKSAAV